MRAIGTSLSVVALAGVASAASAFTARPEPVPVALGVAVAGAFVGGGPAAVGVLLGAWVGALAAGAAPVDALLAGVLTAVPGAALGLLLRRGPEGPYAMTDVARVATFVLVTALVPALGWAIRDGLAGAEEPVWMLALGALPGLFVAAGIPAAVCTCARGRAGPVEGQRGGLLDVFLDNMPAIVFLKDVGGRYRVVNRTFEQFVGRRREDVLGKTDRELFPLEVAQRFEQEDREVRGDHEVRTMEQAVAGVGGPRQFLVTKFPVHGPARFRHAIGGVASDITDFQALSASAATNAAGLRRALSLLEATLEASGEAIVTVDRDRRIGHFNRRYVDLFGFPREVLAARDHDAAVLHARGLVCDPEPYVERVEAIYAAPAEDSFDVLRFRDGRVIERVSRPQRLDEDIVGRVWSFRDVTAFRRTEEALLETNETLRAIIEASPAAILTVDREGRVCSWNAAAERIFGWTEAEVVGRLPPTLPVGGEEDFRARYADILERGTLLEQEVTRRRKDGGEVVVQVSAAPVRASTRTGIALVSVLVDITARRRAEEELLRHRDGLAGLVAERTRALEAANRELEAFTYTVSHDLRAPLRAISGFSSLLAEEARLDEAGKEALARVQAAAGRMTRLIDDLLEHSQVTRRPLRPERVDLSAVAESVVAELRAAEPKRRVEVVVEPGLWAMGDPVLLRSTLQNLVGNAWKFSARRPVAHIAVGALAEREERVFYVRDDGAGFDMADYDRLFLPFERLHSNREFEGTGIGLATVRRIVERHGGRLWAESAVDRGATFYFTLGQKQPAATRALAAAYEG